ncbi:hypothetical protein MSG28_002939 [Choristoneura fumiferana]|uniref:Uncharacterized protein n=1 Tax=Choristoneura fumiferana TaxID=7141 RepID=A0ACC0JKU2_CHOFU|nr:hypothetical protein MSG28_002939 [Choristoneura fumiferana]
MNPMTNVKNVLKLSKNELTGNSKSSWHDQYKDSAWVFVGGLPYDLTEGDIICVFSQYGEVVNINLVRDKATGKSRGFAFICYEDQRSTILAVDNLNGRTVRVDHCEQYRAPNADMSKVDELTAAIRQEGSHAKRIKKKLRRAKRRKRKEVEVPIQVISLMMKNQNNNWGNSFRTQETVQAMEVGRTGRVQVEDIIFLVRKDQRKYARVKDLLTMNEELKKARKAFDEVKYKISNNNDGRTTDSLLLRLMQSEVDLPQK